MPLSTKNLGGRPSGPGLLSKSKQRRRAKEIIAASGCDTEEHFKRVVLQQKVVTFRKQAELWLDRLRTRNNKPIAETSVPTIRSAIDKWLNPNLGDLPLSEVGNGALKALVKNMVESSHQKPSEPTSVMQSKSENR